MSDPFWKEDPSILFRIDKLREFVPTENMSFNQKLNAIIRFLMYFSLLLYIVYKNYESFLLLFIGLGLTYIIYDYQIDININLKNRKDKCQTSDLESDNLEELDNHIPSTISNNNDSNISEDINQKKMTDMLVPPSLVENRDNKGESVSKNMENTMKNTMENTIEPFSGSNSMAPIKETLVNAFDPPSNYENKGPSTPLNENLASSNISPYSVPSCEKGTKTALDANANLCQMPNKDNPFMNILVTDYANNPNRLPACNPEIVRNAARNAATKL